MIISKGNLQLVDVTKVDSKIPVLDCVNVLDDGTTVAGNGLCFIAVSPVPEEMKKKVSTVLEDTESRRVNVSSGTVREVLKNIPSDKKYGGALEHTDIKSKDGRKVDFTLYDGARYREISGKVNPASYPPFEKLFQRALSNKQQIRFVLNMKRLLPMLQTIEKCSQNNADFSPVFIEFTTDNEMIVRSVNPKTGQECIGLMQPLKGVEGKWFEPSEWEGRLKNGYFNDVDAKVVDKNVNTASVGSVCGSNDRNNNRRVGDRSADMDACGSGEHLRRRAGAKKTGNRQTARIIDEMCPWCGKFHLASDEQSKWCSCRRGCNYYEKV